MTPVAKALSSNGVSLRQAGLIAGIAYLLNPVSYAEFIVYPRLIVASDAHQTALNISGHAGLFAAALLCYLISFMQDIVIAWALYLLLRPVNQALSLLAAWFQLVYAAVALCSLFGLLNVYQLLTTPYYRTVFGEGPLQAQVWLQLHTFHIAWDLSLVLFGIHLVLLAYLVYCSPYIPQLVGLALLIAGVGWVVAGVGPYVLPKANFDFTRVTAFGEMIFAFWLWYRGWRVPEPATSA